MSPRNRIVSRDSTEASDSAPGVSAPRAESLLQMACQGATRVATLPIHDARRTGREGVHLAGSGRLLVGKPTQTYLAAPRMMGPTTSRSLSFLRSSPLPHANAASACPSAVSGAMCPWVRCGCGRLRAPRWGGASTTYPCIGARIRPLRQTAHRYSRVQEGPCEEC